MEKLGLENVFTDALDTFKAFEGLTVDNSGVHQEAFPMSVWQILNHLIIWQESQISLLNEIIPDKDISETDTWIKERFPSDELTLQTAVNKFNMQLSIIKSAIQSLAIDDNRAKFEIIQRVSLHLSFHLGEVVLIRRLQGSYPLPHQMKEFLQQ